MSLLLALELTLLTVHSAIYGTTFGCRVYTAHCMLYTVWHFCWLNSVRFSLYAIHCMALVLIVKCTLLTVRSTLYGATVAVQCTLLAVHSTLYGTTVGCTLYTAHCTHRKTVWPYLKYGHIRKKFKLYVKVRLCF